MPQEVSRISTKICIYSLILFIFLSILVLWSCGKKEGLSLIITEDTKTEREDVVSRIKNLITCYDELIGTEVEGKVVIHDERNAILCLWYLDIVDKVDASLPPDLEKSQVMEAIWEKLELTYLKQYENTTNAEKRAKDRILREREVVEYSKKPSLRDLMAVFLREYEKSRR